MNAFSFDITDNSLIVKQENTYPEWVTTERFYNCENFGQIFVKGEPPQKDVRKKTEQKIKFCAFNTKRENITTKNNASGQLVSGGIIFIGRREELCFPAVI